MSNSCALCSLAVVVFLVVCVSANVTVSEEDAKAAVTEAQRTVKTVCDKAQNQLNNAKGLVQKVILSKSEAAQSFSQAASAATGNPKAVAIAETIKSLSDAVATSYSVVKGKLDDAVESFNALLVEANGLKGECNIKITPNQDLPNSFTETNSKATALKGKADNLDERITAVITQVNELYSTTNNMAQSAKKAQFSAFEVSIVVAVAKIETMMGTADANIEETEKKRSEVNGIVEELKELSKTGPKDLRGQMNRLYTSAESQLSSFSYAMDEANKAKAAMQTQKEFADAALIEVKKTDEVNKGMRQVNIAKSCIEEVLKIVPQVESKLQSAETSVINANYRKADAVGALEKSKSKPQTEQKKVSEKTDFLKQGAKRPHGKDAKVNPTTINTDQTKGKGLLRQIKNNAENFVEDTTEIPKKSTTVKTTVINMDKAVMETSQNSMHQTQDQPEIVQSDPQKGKKSEIVKDALSKGTQNATITLFTRKNVPAPGDKNDNAVTVCVPLLVALIASAVLQ